jgi:FlgD Ig-like domain/Bacterial Ig-like domain
MRTRFMRLCPLVIVMLCSALATNTALAQLPQTIVVDGTNDFNVANLLDDDSLDTQIQNWCTADPEDDAPMDLGKIYVTNDTNNLYIGFEYFRDCFSSPQVNLGIAFSYGSAADGSTTDPFSRKIAWNTIVNKPDNVVYAVIDGFNFEAFYEWQGAAWANIGSSINPSYGGGSNGLGMANDLGFEEIALPLSAFTANGFPGLAAGDTLRVEIWMTQDGTTKPPLDAAASDAVQTSTPAGTVFDTGVAVEMDSYLVYVVQNASDTDPPLITSARKNPFADNEVLVTFNEPVDAATASNASNYSIAGTTVNVSSAALDLGASNLVHVGLDAPLTASASLLTLSVTGVQDLASNPIAPGTGDFEFAVKEVVFQGDFFSYLQNNSTGADGFTVEGSKEPLDFSLVSDLFSDMTQVDAVNEIWENTVLFSWGVGAPSAPVKATTFTVEWKFNHNLLNWESVGNRILILDSTDPVSQTLSHFWDDLDPTQFTTQDIDVIFSVDMSSVAPIAGDTIEIAGDQPPLSFAGPFAGMVDDGTGQDTVAGDDIYAGVVRFPTGSLKNVQYKYVFNASFECFGTNNRDVFLNDAVFDTIGGALGPIVMPQQTFDRCGTIAGDLEVVFSVDLRNSIYSGTLIAPVVGLAGDVAPLVFDPLTSAVPMADDGAGFDAVAGDLIYTVSVTFADSSNANLQYKYVVDGAFEGETMPNRSVFLDDSFDAVGNPQLLPLDDVHVTVPTGVDDTPLTRRGIAVSAYPNPFNPQTTIRFEVPSPGLVRVEIFDSRGRLLRTLVDGNLQTGLQTRIWDGRTDDGRAVGSGVYFARVIGPGAVAATKLVLVK